MTGTPRAANNINPPGALLNLRRMLMGLVVLLVCEGLLRKLQIPGTSVVIFLLKDAVVLGMAIQLIYLRQPVASEFLWLAYVTAFAFFMPVFASTLLHDPILAIFGLKEYLLYPIVGLAVITAFEYSPLDEIIGFFRIVALLLVPTAAVAFLQLQLPPDHWLNRSVEGESLNNFSAAGHLRISSTFSFVAQYASFLNMEIVAVIVALIRYGKINALYRYFLFCLVLVLFVCSYITGSRGAVVGNTSVLAVAMGLVFLRFEMGSALRVLGIALAILAAVSVLQFLDPDLFSTYTVREEGRLVGVSDEIQGRVYGSFFGWMGGTYDVPLLGYGLGIMSNGSDLFSDYAGIYRGKGEWTETDFATTLFEGGPYLILVWYAFRYYVIFITTRLFLLRTRGELSIPGAVCQGFVIILGLVGTLGIQPPTAIWWWIGVGLSVTFWWKCVGPKEGEDALAEVVAPLQPKKARGRSAYAERLHSTPKRK